MALVPSVELNNGLHMPAIGLGTWTTRAEDVAEVIKSAIDAGFRHFDSALVYRNEAHVGKAIREKMAEGAVTREELFVVSKLWNTYHRPDLVAKGCRRTLRNLGLDYVDLYLMHWPMAFQPFDGAEDEAGGENVDSDSLLVNPEFFPRDSQGRIAYSDEDYVDTWKEMEKCVDLGLAKSIGISNFNSRQIDRLLRHARLKPVTNQIEVHPYMAQRKLTEFCRERNILVTAYGPLGSQLQSLDPGAPKLTDNPKIVSIARETGKTPAQVILRYLVQLNVVPIPKTSNLQRLAENISIFDFALTPEQMEAMGSLNCDTRMYTFPGAENHKNYPFAVDF